MRGAWTLIPLLLAAAVLAAPPARAGGLGRTFKSEKHGFSIRPPADWEPIPVQPTEKRIVAQFKGPPRVIVTKNSRVSVPRTCEVVLFDRDEFAPETPAVEADAGKPAGPPAHPGTEVAPEDKAPRDPLAWILKIARKPEILEEKDRTVAGRTGKRYVLRIQGSQEEAGGFLALLGVVEAPPLTYGVLYSLPADDFPRERRDLERSLLSLKLFDRADVAAGEGKPDGTEARSPLEKSRVARKAKLDVPPGWYVEDTEHYILTSNTNRKMVREVGGDLERIRLLYEEIFPPDQPIEAVSVVRICKDLQDYLNYGGPRGTAGYWYDEAEELVVYDATARTRADTFRTLYHEAFHQYIFYASGEVAPHSWFNEGYGDYFSGSKRRGRKFVVGKFLWRRDRIKQAVRDGTYVPLERFVRMSKNDYYANGAQNYAQGWAFIYFLNRGTREKAWRRILPTYFDVLKTTYREAIAAKKPKALAKEESREKAVAAAFAGIDFERLESAFVAFTKGL